MSHISPRSNHWRATSALEISDSDSIEQDIGAATQGQDGSNSIALHVGVGFGVAAIGLLVILLVFMCIKTRKKSQYKYTELPNEDVEQADWQTNCCCCSPCLCPSEKDKRDWARKRQESRERDEAYELTSLFSEQREEEYKLEGGKLPEMGSRLQKHWRRGHYRDTTEILVTEAPLTKQCCVELKEGTLDTINRKLLLSLRKHPFIHPIIKIYYEQEGKKILTIQPLVTKGSLRDYIFNESPLVDWSKKYLRHGRALSQDQVSLFGSQILEAMHYLYRQGFVMLGHVHTGNIFVFTDTHCKLGGYENTLLGYRTRSHKKCFQEGCLEHIDKIMFGHVVYEMGSGRELKDRLFPQDTDYVGMQQAVAEMVQFIFELQNTFNLIMSQWYKVFSVEKQKDTPLSDSQKVKRLLEAASSGNVVRQKSVTMEDPQQKRMTAQAKLEGYLEQSPYQLEEHLPDIGRRLWKYWTKVETEQTTALLSISIVDKNFTFNEKTLRDYFTLVRHPYLQQPKDIHYLKETRHVILVHELMERGSLRDLIHRRNPLRNWTEKLQSRGSSLSIEKIALYGKQILEAMLFLYGQGFPPLGHVHAGNMYVKVDEEEKEVCCLGGHENLLIGYETSQRVFAHRVYSDALDLKMFGHVMYEMSAGKELDKEVPVESDYELVRGNRERVQGLLSRIFSMCEKVRNGAESYQSGLQTIKDDDFFSNTELKPPVKLLESDDPKKLKHILESMKQLFDRVSSKRKGPGGVKKVLKKLGTAVSIS